jgi:hypothetical protein
MDANVLLALRERPHAADDLSMCQVLVNVLAPGFGYRLQPQIAEVARSAHLKRDEVVEFVVGRRVRVVVDASAESLIGSV